MKYKTLGEGGFGKAKLTTYKGEKAVIKYINTTGDPRATLATCTINRKDANYEGEIMKLFDHKNIAKIYEIQGHCIIMKYYPLGSLKDLIDRGEVKNDRHYITRDIVRGLKAIHKLNYVHCDLKASNILCERDEYGGIRAVISDFGGAKLRGSKLGAYTPGFCPPEVLEEGKPVDFSTDMYALGKLLLELYVPEADVTKIAFDWNWYHRKYFYNNKIVKDPKNPGYCIVDQIVQCLEPVDKRLKLDDLDDIVSSFDFV